MPPSRLALPSAYTGSRIFRGYRNPALTKQEFYRELGHTFMPGTPLMQAPLGLAAYLPAVLNLPDYMDGYPDEIALIVYANRGVYDAKRQTSLSRRIYTHAHSAVFDMERSSGNFPGDPNIGDQPELEQSWYLNWDSIDWQDGQTRIAFVAPTAARDDFANALRQESFHKRELVKASGYDQMVCIATPTYAALWLHSSDPPSQPLDEVGILPPDAEVIRDLICEPAYVVDDEETGVDITDAAAFNWLFSRDLRFFRRNPYSDERTF
ncbi:hypothetical protein ACAG24_024130 [Mycobacterium sp. pW049]|uniref:hypothetical protein n=1 Tax=[Mycobacterium] bulgaricum TaxID=3238985 RepID=UPI00351BCDC7